MSTAEDAVVSTIEYLPLHSDDMEQSIALWDRSEGVSLRGADSPESLQRYLLRNPDLSYVARSAGALVGAVLCGHDGRRGYLHHLAVDPGWRRLGIGRALVDRCLAGLAREGIEKCHIFVYRDNRDGRAFWEALGWSERGDLLLMSYALSADA